MTARIKVPGLYHRIDADSPVLVSEGPKRVKLTQLEATTENQVDARFQVLDGDEKGCVLPRPYHLDNHYGVHMFKQLMESLGIEPDAEDDVDLNAAVDRELIVTVAHRVNNGTTYANVVGHQSAG